MMSAKKNNSKEKYQLIDDDSLFRYYLSPNEESKSLKA